MTTPDPAPAAPPDDGLKESSRHAPAAPLLGKDARKVIEAAMRGLDEHSMPDDRDYADDADVIALALEPLVAALVAEKERELDWTRGVAEDAEENLHQARLLVEAALFLRQNGERPPGAPRNDLAAETWPRWDEQAERWLRGGAS